MALQTDFAIITHPIQIHISHFTDRSLRLEDHGNLRWLLGEMTDQSNLCREYNGGEQFHIETPS